MTSYTISAAESAALAARGEHRIVGHEVPEHETDRPRGICCCGAVGPTSAGHSSDEETVPTCCWNWHITWTGASTTNGATATAPGYYPEDDEAGTNTVAPGEYVRAYCAQHDPTNEYPETRAQAVRAWAWEQGLPCG